MKRSLVTGAAGFIGSHLVDKLIEIGHYVIAIDNESANNEKFYWNSKAENHKLNICDFENTKSLYEGVDYVFHLAAESRIQPAIENPINAVYLNCVGTTTVLQCARLAGVKKVVYSSTSSGYGMNPSPNVETQPDDCINPYSVSKIAGEKLCKMYTDLFNLNTVIFRYFNVYGERSPTSGQYAPVIGIFQRQRANNEPLTVVGTGEKLRDFVHVSDVAEANILVALKDVDAVNYGQVYNVGTGENISIIDIAKRISDNYIFIPPRLGEVETTLANIEKIQRVFGWKPKVNIRNYPL